MRAFCRPALAAVLSVPAALSAGAAEYRLAFPQGTEACFIRQYDRAHLAAHPRQSVTRLIIARNQAALRREAIDGPEAPELALAVSVRLRGAAEAGPEPLDCHGVTALEAGEGGRERLQCASACGRGDVDILVEGPNRLVLRIGGTVEGQPITHAIGIGRSCSRESNVVWLGDEPAERVFVLERAPAARCRP